MNKNNDSKERLGKPALLTELMHLISRCESAYGQKRVFNRVLALVMAELFAFGRHTITQLLLTLGIIDEDWSAWYRLFSHERFDEEQTSAVMLGEMLAEVEENDPFVVGADGFHVPRCSQAMPGTGWMKGLNTAKFKPGIQRGQRFVEGSWLTPIVSVADHPIAFASRNCNAKTNRARGAVFAGHGSSWMRPGAKRKRC
ncbi:MAG: transposase [Pseudomonadales bacterium]|nr:transposase [Pseudomonadales bacterium]